MFGNGRGFAVVFDGDGKEESFAEHDRHYHPDGYKDGDKCNKREKLEREDGVSPTEAPEMTIEEIKRRLKEEYGVTLCDFAEANEVVAEHGSEGFKKGWEMAERPTDAEFKETAGRVLRVLDDLNERFHYKPPLNYLFCVRFKEIDRDGQKYGIGGLSEEDHIWTNLSKMAIAVNPPEWSGMSFGYKDSDKHRNAIIRHEIGHISATKSVIRDYGHIRNFLKTYAHGNKNFKDIIIDNASQMAYVMQSELEEISEIFARATDKGFPIDSMNSDFLLFVQEILHGGYENA